MNALKRLSVILVSFWLAACVTTGTTKTSQPSPPGPSQTTRERQTPAPEPGSEQEASGKSSSSQTASREDSAQSKTATAESEAAQEQKASEKAASSQSAAREDTSEGQQQPVDAAGETPATAKGAEKSSSPTAAEERAAISRQKSGEKGGSRQAASPQSAESKLAEARENLRISEATERRIAAELEQLKQSGTASPETIKNYETYHESVRQMVAENRKIVEQMEAAKARHASDPASSDASAGGQPGNLLDPSIPEGQTTDEVAALDRQLNASLNEFDARLLKEMDEIREESSTKMRDLAQEAAEAAKRLREKGVDVETAGTETSADAGKSESRKSEETQAEQGAEGTKTASGDTSRAGGEGSGSGQQDRASYADDDIVARQLREAAENETDPELKKKLWEEYYEYKKGQK